MHGLEQHTQHLLTVMLCEALELNGLSGDPVLDVPWGHVAPSAHPDILKKFGEGHGKTSSRSKSILLVNMLQVDLE